jgi:hypothetical protein
VCSTHGSVPACFNAVRSGLILFAVTCSVSKAENEIKWVPEQPQLKGFRLHMQDDFNPPEGAFSQNIEETCTNFI